ncbi:Trimeric GatFAB AmidoTransferase(AdT) complex subunit [Lunasporangiospora selenospora]|uniref:Glutamyl-tRNA(Gln) amidotransferase subunit A, mitochondrial n=1 Tax=Lunasporangiospora selenospora TaxID=979761 RepID=A0A9P6FTY7_9FUNG|nr:Trimeric GatFAB AmidoTransferase(AdT) complex subunit [Lunasporangiospora selenospora]
MKRSADTRNVRAGSAKKQATGVKFSERKASKPTAAPAINQSRTRSSSSTQPKGILKVRGQTKTPTDKKPTQAAKKDSDDDELGDDEGESDGANDDEAGESSGDSSDDDLEGVTAALKSSKETAHFMARSSIVPQETSTEASKKATEETMAETMSKILGATLRKKDVDTPILAKSRGVERKLEEERVEAKARKAIASEKKRLEHKDRVKPEYTGMEYEKKLRKVATRGVVQLFNAIKVQQKAGEDMPGRGAGASANAKEKGKVSKLQIFKIHQMSTRSFLNPLIRRHRFVLRPDAGINRHAALHHSASCSRVFNESVTPLSAAKASLENITEYNNYINAFVDLADPVKVEDQAKEATQRWELGQPISPIDGALFGYKMNFCTTDLRTTCGSAMLQNFEAPYTATAVDLLQKAGAITGGKVNMDEFGMGSYNVFSDSGPAKNPWNVVGHPIDTIDTMDDRSPGGSSGGSAAAVASKMCFAALGSDTGGSVRLPASYCGVVGFKPSYGRVSRWGLVSYASSLDTVGVLTRSVDDAKIVFDVISQEDPKDSTCLTQEQRHRITESLSLQKTHSQNADKPLSGIRIGVPQEFHVEELSEATVALWKAGIRKLEDAGATVLPVSLPNTNVSVGAYFTIATAEASSNLQKYDGVRYGRKSAEKDTKEALYAHTRSEGFGVEVRRRILLGTYVLTSGSFDNYFLRAQKIRRMVRNDFDNVFSQPNAITGSTGSQGPTRVHALITPCAVTTAPKLSECSGSGTDPITAYLDDILTIPASLAGIPAMSVPFGLSKEDGYPVGLQVMAQYGDEDMVFKVAKVLEHKS